MLAGNKVHKTLLCLTRYVRGGGAHRRNNDRRGALDINIMAMIALQLSVVQVDKLALRARCKRYNIALLEECYSEEEYQYR